MYELLGISLVLATLLTINAVASMAAAAIWRLLERPMRRCSAQMRAEVIFAIRVGPPTAALISIGAFLIPSYLVYEPYHSGEIVSNKLAALAAISGVGIGLALWRGCHSWVATRSLSRSWLSIATPMKFSDINIPTFRFPHSFPIIAVVGTVRPRLFIAERVLESLSQEELVAAIAHEYGHLAARDNFKRSLLRACCDALLIIPCGRSLDRAWSEASESAADEYAARESSTVALNLASALVRIAKMIPEGKRAAMPAAAFFVGEETRGVKARVRRLLEIASSDYRRSIHGGSRMRLFPWMSIGFFVLLILASTTHLLATVHSLVERVVSFLS
jgi:Zn-dependent protease with chaperone function